MAQAVTSLIDYLEMPGTPLILIVDDNIDAREMYGMYLQHEGFRWAEAVNGRDAITQTKNERPSLILMDATMPRMDGWEAVRLLKEDAATRNIPLIMLTAHAFDEHRDRAKQAGADAFLAKPVLPDQLTKEIRRILAGANQSLSPE
jgi:two-component system, cell cycle response regulator DivK